MTVGGIELNLEITQAGDEKMNLTKDWQGVRIYTVGHALLQAFGVSVLTDIRTLPRSRRNPQFNRDTLPAALRPWGMRYAHLPRLGGLRRAHA